MSDSTIFVAVAVPTPLRNLFHYSLPADKRVSIGARVRVPFGSRVLVGVVTEVGSQPDINIAKVRPVLEVLNARGNLTEPILRLCRWASDYYHHPIGEVLASALPTLLRKGADPHELSQLLILTPEGLLIDQKSLGRAHAQRKLMGALKQCGRTRKGLSAMDISSQTIRSIEKKGWALWRSKVPESLEPFASDSVDYSGIKVTEEQATAIDEVQNHTDGKPFLLYGVTGSGKTEVYLRVMEPLLKAGKQVLILVPEIGLTPQTISRFQDRFDVPITILHSSLTDKQRALGWLEAREGSAGIILGTRSAIYTPLKFPGAIIVDEEHDASYKQQDGFRYSARDLAVLRAGLEGVPVILGSATPSLESLHNANSGKYHLLKLTTRPPGIEPESYELLDTRQLEHKAGLTRALRHQIGERLANREQVLIFINRRGFAPVMICNDCSWIAHCRRCDAKLTYHLNTNTLVCHHCGTISHDITNCQSCRSSQLSTLGLGSQRIEQTLKAMFPEFPVLRIDRDSTRRKGSMESFILEINTGEPAILVGTQLLAKGHHFPNVTLVAMLDIDSGFYSTDFRATERLGQTILQVGGRSGRADKPGTVTIQTAFATHTLMEKLVQGGYYEFATDLLQERKDAGLPPFAFHAIIRAEANASTTARLFLESIVTTVQVSNTVNLLGPIPALMEKKAGRYRQLLIVTSENRSDLHREVRHIIRTTESLPDSKKVRWSVDVDPTDMF
jgi:primosomal protein N' (replication factor Y)